MRCVAWLCVVMTVLAGLMSVSPAVHDVFCLDAQLAASGDPDHHQTCAGDEDACVATLFQTGILHCIIPVVAPPPTPPQSPVNHRRAARTSPGAPRNLHPPSNGPPQG